MGLDPAAEEAAITAALRALAPELTAVPMIKTSRPFYGARVGDLRATATGWLRANGSLLSFSTNLASGPRFFRVEVQP